MKSLITTLKELKLTTSPNFVEDPWDTAKNNRTEPSQPLTKSVLAKAAPKLLQRTTQLSQEIKSLTPYHDYYKSPEPAFDAEKPEFESIGSNRQFTLKDLYRSYKSSPHWPLSTCLKYLIHRVENHNVYKNLDQTERVGRDYEFLKLCQRGESARKNGGMSTADLHNFIHHHGDLINELIDHKQELNQYLINHRHAVNINGEPHVPLTRGLNVTKDDRGPDHALASYADADSTGFGDYMHHQWVPVKNIWYSYDMGPKDATSLGFGNEKEWTVSPHQVKYRNDDLYPGPRLAAPDAHFIPYNGDDHEKISELIEKNKDNHHALKTLAGANPHLGPDHYQSLFNNPLITLSELKIPHVKNHDSQKLLYKELDKHGLASEQYFAANPHLSPDLQKHIIDKYTQSTEKKPDTRALSGLAKNPGLHPDFQKTLFDTGMYHTELATNPSVHPELLSQLADHAVGPVPGSISGAPEIKNSMILGGLIENPNLPHDIQKKLISAEKPGGYDTISVRLSRHVGDLHPEVQMHIAKKGGYGASNLMSRFDTLHPDTQKELVVNKKLPTPFRTYHPDKKPLMSVKKSLFTIIKELKVLTKSGYILEKGLKGDWKKEGYDIVHDYHPNKQAHNISAYDKDGNKVGGMWFYEHEDGSLKVSPGSQVWVKDEDRRKGIASAMYSLGESKVGKKFKQGYTTPAGSKIWSQPNRPFGESLEKGLKGDWKKEGYTIHHEMVPAEDVGYSERPWFPEGKLRVYALNKDGEKVAGCSINHAHSKTLMYPRGIHVDTGHERKGLASAMYEYAEKLMGKKVVPQSGHQSPAGSALWKQPNRPFGRKQEKKIDNYSEEEIDNYNADLGLPNKLNKSDDNQTPRSAAKVETFKELTGDEYKNARKSKFSNKGEDIANSARHKAAEWKGLAHAESTGQAGALVNLKTMLKNDPPNIVPTKGEDALNALAAHYVMQKFPKAPDTSHGIGDNDKYHEYERDGKLFGIRDGVEPPANSVLKRTWTGAEINQELRKHYVSIYKKIKETVETNKTNPIQAARSAAIGIYHDLGKNSSKYAPNVGSLASNFLVPYVNKVLKSTARSPSSVTGALTKYGTEFHKKYGYFGVTPDNESDHNSKMLKHVTDVIAGKSLAETFASTKTEDGKPKFSVADVYVGHATRNGPDHGWSSKDHHEDFLLNKAKLRGLQYGNSVTDKEREHHLRHASYAMRDMADLLGLPHEMVSFNGRLGFAVGARGFGKALAHYEPTLRTINLTRKGGVGSLAHEWGHFFDNVLHETVTGDKHKYASENLGHSHYGRSLVNSLKDEDKADGNKIFEAMSKVSNQLDVFGKRIKNDYYNKHSQLAGMSIGKLHTYWLSKRELFARAFENYVHHKMAKNGKENTYLVGLSKDHVLWPNQSETDALHPLFDELFNNFKGTKYLKKSMQLAGSSRLAKDLLSGGKADGITTGFNKNSLKQGVAVESEHTDSPVLASEIARDHLTEDPDYYDKLAAIEAKYKHVASIAVLKGRKILMGRRNDNSRWTLPGGHLNAGEAPLKGAMRELKEETGITSHEKMFQSLGSRKVVTYTGKHMIIHSFQVDFSGQTIDTSSDPDAEVKNWVWIDYTNGLPQHILNNLHSPKNATLKLLGLQDYPEDAQVFQQNTDKGIEAIIRTAMKANNLMNIISSYKKAKESLVVEDPWDEAKNSRLGKSDLHKAGKPKTPKTPNDSQPKFLDEKLHAVPGWENYNTSVFHGLDHENPVATANKATFTPQVHFLGTHPKSQMKAIVKPATPVGRSEDSVYFYGTREGSYLNHKDFNTAHREATYHRASDVFGLSHYVPKTSVFIHPKDGKVWSAQEIIPGAKHVELHSNTYQRYSSPELTKLAVMNTILGNNDRHNNNTMIDREGGLKMIDHGLAFDYGHNTTMAFPAYSEHLRYKPLDQSVGHWLHSVDENKLKSALHQSGAPSDVVDMALSRLATAKEHYGKDNQMLDDYLTKIRNVNFGTQAKSKPPKRIKAKAAPGSKTKISDPGSKPKISAPDTSPPTQILTSKKG